MHSIFSYIYQNQFCEVIALLRERIDIIPINQLNGKNTIIVYRYVGFITLFKLLCELLLSLFI